MEELAFELEGMPLIRTFERLVADGVGVAPTIRACPWDHAPLLREVVALAVERIGLFDWLLWEEPSLAEQLALLEGNAPRPDAWDFQDEDGVAALSALRSGSAL